VERTFKLTQCPSPALYPLHSPFACPKAPPSALSNPIHKPATGHKTRPAPMLKTHRLPPLNHQPIQLIKLTNNRLPLSTTTPSSALYFPYPIQYLPLSHHNSYPTPPPKSVSSPTPSSTPTQRTPPNHTIHLQRNPTPQLPKKHTFIILNSLIPLCSSSCTRRSSTSPRCSRKASIVRRRAYSRKLYEANCRDRRRRERN